MLQYAAVSVLLYEPSRHQQTDPGRRLLGLIVVTDSRFTRSAHPTSCQLLIVTASQLSGRQVTQDIFQLFSCVPPVGKIAPPVFQTFPLKTLTYGNFRHFLMLFV